MNVTKTIFLSAIVGAVIGSGVVFFANSTPERTKADFIREFYEVETAVHVSPHSLRKQMDKGDLNFTLVDLRSPQEYERAHIIGAINIPAYIDPNHSISLESDAEATGRIIAAFKALPPEKDVIVYCYSIPCMTGRKVGKLLADNDVFVKHLGIGWNEWRFAWTSWNHEHEWKATKPEEYIMSGTEPGIPQKRDLPSPCGEGSLSC